MGKLVGILMILLVGGVGFGLYTAPGWMAAQIAATFGMPSADDRSFLPRLKAVVMDGLVKSGAPCNGIHRMETARQDGYDATLTAICMNDAAYNVRFKPTGEMVFQSLR